MNLKPSWRSGQIKPPSLPIVGAIAASAAWALGKAAPQPKVTSEEAWVEVVANFYGITREEARTRIAANDARLEAVRRAIASNGAPGADM